jgi:hypothetical protein
MNSRTLTMVVVCGALMAFAGCGETGDVGPTAAPSQAEPATLAPAGNPGPVTAPSYLRVWIDGQPAQPVPTQVAAPGISNWRVARPVSTAPRLKYEVVNNRLGKPNAVSVGIFKQDAGGRTAPQADYSIYSTDPNSQAEIRPGAELALGRPGGKIGVQNGRNEPIDGVKLTSRQKYLLVLNVKGNQSETAQIEFVTR